MSAFRSAAFGSRAVYHGIDGWNRPAAAKSAGRGALALLRWRAIALCGMLTACTTIDPGKDRIDATYVGIVHVVVPPSARNAASGSDPVVAFDSRGIGLRVQDGVGAGWFHDQSYRMPPDCRVVIFVQDASQLEAISKQLKEFKEGICATVKSP